jgi:uncharacterized membrane-anchored protein
VLDPGMKTSAKVPQVTAAFWAMKICATTLGETAGDLLSMTLNVGYALSTMLLLGMFAASLAAQLKVKSFRPALYWAVILSTSTAGTTMSDFMDRSLGLGYLRGSVILATLLVVVLAAWRSAVGSLSVENISNLRAESFYWAAILVSNTLGTALGDYLADSSGLGFAGGAVLVSCLIGLVALAHRFTRASKVALFWLAFVLTRPFGATFGDLLTKPHESGGFAFGTIGSSAILACVLIVLVGWSMRQARRPEAA